MKLEQILDIIDRPTAWAWIRRTYLPAGVVCPVCGAMITGSLALASFSDLKRTYCTGHGGSFRPQAAIAPLRGTEWAPEEFVKLLILSGAGQGTADIAPLLGKSAGCVRDMLDRLSVLDLKHPTGGGPLEG